MSVSNKRINLNVYSEIFKFKRENLNFQVATYMILQRGPQEEGANHIWEWASALCSGKWRQLLSQLTGAFQLLIVPP